MMILAPGSSGLGGFSAHFELSVQGVGGIPGARALLL